MTDLLRGLVSGERTARDLPEELRSLAVWIEAHSGAVPNPETTTATPADLALKVYEHWLRATKRNPAQCRYTPERKTKVLARLREGFTVADICGAIDYVAQSDWHQGGNESGKRYDDLTIICRNATKLESYRNAWRDETPGAHRSDVGSGMQPMAGPDPEMELRQEAREALKRGDISAYNAAQNRLRALRPAEGGSPDRGGSDDLPKAARAS